MRERPLGLHVDQCSLAVIQDARYKYVHFDALPPLFFDLEADPGQFRNVAGDPAYASRVLAYAQKMLSWRLHHADRTLTGWSASPEGLVDRSAACTPGRHPDARPARPVARAAGILRDAGPPQAAGRRPRPPRRRRRGPRRSCALAAAGDAGAARAATAAVFSLPGPGASSLSSSSTSGLGGR